jgi:dTDP-4-dehydrorhamnose reductase
MIWIIGCNGMLGKELSALCVEKNIPFIGTDRECDITDINALRSFAVDKKIDWIVNCSAYTAVDKAEEEEEIAYKINAIGAGNIAAVSSEIGVPMIQISTDYVFDGKGSRPYAETDPVNPAGAYGRTKLAGEKLIAEKTDKYFILRTAWLYGQYGNNFVRTMIRLFKEKESLNVVCDQKGSPTWAYDLSEMILAIVKKNSTSYGIYHFSNEGETTWYEFACEISHAALAKGLIEKEIPINPVTTDKYPSKVKRPEYSVLSKKKIADIFGVTVPVWKESLKKYINSICGRNDA